MVNGHSNVTELTEFLAGEQSMDPKLQVFFDGDCPLCRREIQWLKRRDLRQSIAFTDIAAPDFDLAEYDKTRHELMSEIHARTADGRWITGVEVFRRLYRAAGFTRLVAISRWPLIRSGLNLGYRLFSRYRTRLPGRRCRRCQVEPPSDRESSGNQQVAGDWR